MTMFKCLECGHLFENGEEAVWYEKHGLDTPPYEEMRGCPRCKGDYEEIKPCIICESYNHDTETNYCVECREKVQKSFLKLLDENFNDEEKSIINDCIEYVGEWVKLIKI